MGLSVTPLTYGPVPLHVDQGEQAFFSFQVSADPGTVVSGVTASVQLFDGNANLVRTLSTPISLKPGGTTAVSLAWDGKDDLGQPLPPGDYAPTFVASGQTA